MCGIAGFHVKDPTVIKKHEGVELLVDELFRGIEHRGKHASGFVAVGFDGKVTLDKAAKPASEFIKDRDKIPEKPRTVLLHTRYATLGHQRNQENNHPVVYGSCFATHNGHINNHAQVYEDLNLTRNAEVDSSVIAAAANYHGIGELDDIKATLQAMEGPMACAIINPVTHPGRVILAKGQSSPLYIVDTPKFTVWASTVDTIKNAWGVVLGTPPNEKKIEQIYEGNFIVIDDGDVTRDKFTVKRRPFESSSRQGVTQNRSGQTRGKNGRTSGFGFGRHEAPKVDATPVVHAREAIAEFIKAGGTVRHFEAHQNGEYSEDDFKDVTTGRRWHPCYGCNRLVIEEDRVKSDWGTICSDCYTATKREIIRNTAEQQDWGNEDEVLAGTSIPRINPADRDALEVWADHEMNLHREVIEEMSKACGSYYSEQAIEFLCFQTTPEYREVAGDAVNALITELRDEYERFYLDIVASTWESVEEGDSCAVPQETNNHPLLLEAGTKAAGPDRFCYQHNRAYTHVCLECAEMRDLVLHGSEDEDKDDSEVGVYLPFERGRDTVVSSSGRRYTRSSGGTETSTEGNESDEPGGEVIDLPRCGKCHTFVLRASEDGCVVCKQSASDDSTHEGATCIACKHDKAAFIVGYAGKNYYYCKSCFNVCRKLVPGEDGRNVVSLCNKPTKHTLKDGVRVCHTHVRKQSGSLSDTLLFRRGATITEV